MKKLALVMFFAITVCIFVFSSVTYAQFDSFSREDRIEFTGEWTGERFPDGRPKVPDEILERMKEVAIEEAWGVLRGHGYRHQFEGGWMNMHPDRIIVGRAVTAYFMPQRPDVHNTTEKRGKEKGCIGGQIPGSLIRLSKMILSWWICSRAPILQVIIWQIRLP